VVGIASGLRTGQSGARTPLGATDLSFIQNIGNSSGDHLAFYSMRSGVSSKGLKQTERETNQLIQIMPTLRMSRVLTPLL
jgi:hypothetical protein